MEETTGWKYNVRICYAGRPSPRMRLQAIQQVVSEALCLLFLVKVARSAARRVEKWDDLEGNLKISLKIIHIFMLNRHRPISEIYWQHCAQCKAPAYKLLRGRFWGFSPRRGDTLHRRCEIWHGGVDRSSTPPCQISPHRCHDNGIGAPKLNFLLKFDQTSEPKRPAVAYPLRNVHEIRRVYTLFRMR